MHPELLPLLTNRADTVWYEAGVVVILDRRLYPRETVYRRYTTYEGVARAIEDMVIQGAPPLAYAAGYGLALAAREVKGRPQAEQLAALKKAAARLLATRPTGADLAQVLSRALDLAREALERGDDVEAALRDYTDREVERGDRAARGAGYHAARLLADGDTVLTHCFAGAALNYMFYFARKMGKQVQVYATETRPYLQGARLTVGSLREMGVPVTLITDNMPGYLFYRGLITKYITAADSITMSGHIVNKVGTYQYAVLARHSGVPFIVLGYDGPDVEKASAEDIVIEERDPQEVLRCAGVQLVAPDTRAYYPAFDITPPELVTAIATDRGVFSPVNIADYLEAAAAEAVPAEWLAELAVVRAERRRRIRTGE